MTENGITAIASPFLRSPLGIAVLMIASTFTGSFLRDRLSTETRDTTSTVRVDALEKQVDQIRIEQSTRLTSNQFNEFRNANDKRLDEIGAQLRDLLAEVNSSYRLRTR